MNIKIRSIETEYPENIVDNEFYINHFKEQGKDINRLLEAFGRKERRIVNNDSDTTLSMGIQASLKVLESANLKGDDIDLIIFSSQFPEYICPTQALIVHNAIKGKNDTIVMDLNVNCLGMLVTLDTASRQLLQNKKLKRALIIGSDYASIHMKHSDELCYPMFADAACAMILEKTNEECGFIDSDYFTDSKKYSAVMYPQCGSSSYYKDTTSYDDMKFGWSECNDDVIDIAVNSINKLLKDNNLNISDISAFCLSQFALPIINGCIDRLRLDSKKVIFVGDKFGYTGTSSPLMAFNDGVKSGKIKRGDYVVFWSIAATRTACSVLYKY
ncbi:ketoacyl-ACP synthase III [Clostridium botulinum]|nr:ketoacyl-ACP synthase III [Clostridium botulinum]